MTTIPTYAPRGRTAQGPWVSILDPAWLLAREILVAPGTAALMVTAVALGFVSLAWLPLGISASQIRAKAVGEEIRLLLLACLALFVLVRAARWGTPLNRLRPAHRVVVVALSGLYVHIILHTLVVLPDWLLFQSTPSVDWGVLGVSLWLTSLGGVLALSRLDPRTLGLVFLLLAWCVPALGLTGAVDAQTITPGIAHPPWGPGGILPMLVPQLLAVGYVCLERAQR